MALALPTASRAQVSLGLRLGYAPAGGDFQKDAKMSDGIKAQIPIQLDALYKVNPNIGAGLYFSYGFGQLASDACETGADCSANDIRIGVQGLYTFNVEGAATKFVPWAGLGLGWERGSTKMTGGGADATLSSTGYEFNIQLGGDYKVNEQLSVGPYVMLSVGQYSSVKFDGFGPLMDGSHDIEDKGLHQWYNFGLRGRFDL
jgi:hypothetical protein